MCRARLIGCPSRAWPRRRRPLPAISRKPCGQRKPRDSPLGLSVSACGAVLKACPFLFPIVLHEGKLLLAAGFAIAAEQIIDVDRHGYSYHEPTTIMSFGNRSWIVNDRGGSRARHGCGTGGLNPVEGPIGVGREVGGTDARKHRGILAYILRGGVGEARRNLADRRFGRARQKP